MSHVILTCPKCGEPANFGVGMPRFSTRPEHQVDRITCRRCGLTTIPEELVPEDRKKIYGGSEPLTGPVLPITVLSADRTGGDLLLSFTVPGFSGALPGFYDIRGSATPILTEADWNAATILDGPWAAMAFQPAWTPVGVAANWFFSPAPIETNAVIRFKSVGGVVGPISNNA